MKKILVLLVLIGGGVWAYHVLVANQGDSSSKPGVHIGATVEQVEKEWGQPLTVLPNFGNELRMYKAPSGKKYTLLFNEGKVIEIHD